VIPCEGVQRGKEQGGLGRVTGCEWTRVGVGAKGQRDRGMGGGWFITVVSVRRSCSAIGGEFR
jgi:hypothetical protein